MTKVKRERRGERRNSGKTDREMKDSGGYVSLLSLQHAVSGCFIQSLHLLLQKVKKDRKQAIL